VRKRSLHVQVDHDSFYIMNPDTPYALHLHEVYHDPLPTAWPLGAEAPKTVQLVHLVGSVESIDTLFQQASLALQSVAAVARSLPTDITITCKDANKGFACSRLRATLGLTGGWLGIGDSGNDIPMLQSADVSVAMANARAETKEAASFETAATNADGPCPGVLEAARAVCSARQTVQR
jgi:hydroxymethylpyrimidine pyrophosphatase-like HAD family hydrolase